MKIDVVMITKDSLRPCLGESLESIFENVPLHCLIVIDAFSSDGTLELIRSYQLDILKLLQCNCGRGEARERGIKEVDTEWFAFVDSDVILAEDWFERIKTQIRPDVGGVEGNVNQQKINPSGRAYTNCTLIRTRLVKDIEIPREMTVYEDQFIRKHIEDKGFKWLKVTDPCSTHKPTSNRVKDAFEIGRMAGKYRLFPFWKHLSVCFLAPKKYLINGESPRIYLNKLFGHIKGIIERSFYER